MVHRRIGGAVIAALAAIAAPLLASPAGAATFSVRYIYSPLSPCPDCDDDGRVTVDELVTHIGIALQTSPLDACVVADADGDGVVTVHEVIGGVQAALGGCDLSEVLVADSSGDEQLELVRSGAWLRAVVSVGSRREADVSLNLARWLPGRAYDITVTWGGGRLSLQVDGQPVAITQGVTRDSP